MKYISMRKAVLAAGDIEGKLGDLSMVFPWLVRDPKPLDEIMSDAIDAVVSASSQGHITEVEAEFLLREILAAWASQSIMEMVDSALQENTSGLGPPSAVRGLLSRV